MDELKVMHDLETLGVNNKAVILSIGAVAFDKFGLKQEFYVVVNPKSCIDVGLTMDLSTVEWWIKQASKDPKSADIFHDKNRAHIADALQQFSVWFASVNGGELWGNGSDFDNAIMKSAYKATGLIYPVEYYNDRCYRTVKSIYPKLDIKREGTHHNALDDAKHQARYLIELMNKYNLQ